MCYHKISFVDVPLNPFEESWFRFFSVVEIIKYDRFFIVIDYSDVR
jgi:hypothetical protein